MNPEIIKMLKEAEQPEEIEELKSYLLTVLKRSRGGMSKYYKKWDRNLEVFKGVRSKDEEDYEAEELGEPIKSVIPLSYAQVQTFVAFGFLLLTQNRTFFEFSPIDEEAYPLYEESETLLERDLRKNQWSSRLYQFLLDLGRFGMGVTVEYWTEETIPVTVKEEALTINGPLFSAVDGPMERVVDAILYEGNKIDNVSPYNFLPDMRLPLVRWREGQFCGHECEHNISHLRKLEDAGTIVGTEHVSAMDRSIWKERGETRLPSLQREMESSKNNENDFMCVLTTVQVKLIPSKYGLGPEKRPKDYIVRLANDQRIVGIEEAGYLHGQFIYNVAQLSPDMQSKVNDSLSDVVHALQDVITWLINSRIVSVRNSLENHLIVDPTCVDMADVEARSPVIKMKKSAPKTGIDKFVQQLRVEDRTSSHFQDADTLMRVMNVVTGVNENALGQYAPGRRSATENRAANAGAASRMKMQIKLAFDQALAPMGLKMNTNQRQSLSLESFVKILGKSKEGKYALFHPASPLDLVGCEDFFMFDSTMSSEKGYVAQSLQELIQAMVANPEVMMATGFNLPEAVNELQYLRGINNASRFFNNGGVAQAQQAVVPGQTGIPLPGMPPERPALPSSVPQIVPGQ